MLLETFVKYTRWSGMYKKMRTIDRKYETTVYYKLRAWHPFCILLYIVSLIIQIIKLAIENAKDFKEDFYINYPKQ